MRQKDLKEGLADLAYKVESDHEVQMARAELYKVAKYAIKLHEMLKGVTEKEGLEGWVQSKITKAADYMSSVYHHMDYEQKFDEVQEEIKSVPYEVVKGSNGEALIKFDGKDVRPEEIGAHVLMKLKEDAEKYVINQCTQKYSELMSTGYFKIQTEQKEIKRSRAIEEDLIV